MEIVSKTIRHDFPFFFSSLHFMNEAGDENWKKSMSSIKTKQGFHIFMIVSCFIILFHYRLSGRVMLVSRVRECGGRVKGWLQDTKSAKHH